MYYQLKSFIVISDLKSVSLAAKKLYLTQPALTQHVRFLEDQFKVKLIGRVGNAMELTAEGKLLYDAAKGLVEQFEQLGKIFSASDEKKTLRFSTIDSATLSILPAAIKGLLAKTPQTQLIPHIEASAVATGHLLEGKLDLAICTLDHLPPTLGKEIIFREKLIFIGSAKHCTIRSALNLNGISMILFPKSSMTRGLIDKIISDLKLTPKISFETIKVSAITAFVEAGMGVSLVPYYSVLKDLKAGRIIELPIKTNTTRTVGVTYPKDRPLPPVALEFIRQLRKAAASL